MSAADCDAADCDAADCDAVDGDADGDGDAGTSGSSSSVTCTKSTSSKLILSDGTGLALDGLIMVLTPLMDGSGDVALGDGLGFVCLLDAVGLFIPRNISCRPFKYVDALSASSLLLKCSGRNFTWMFANAFKVSRL